MAPALLAGALGGRRCWSGAGRLSTSPGSRWPGTRPCATSCPIYPTLAILAAWGLGDACGAHARLDFAACARAAGCWQIGVGVAGALVLLLTLAWAFAFTRIYTRTETRVAASRWIFENVPGPVNLRGMSDERGHWQQIAAAARAGHDPPRACPYLPPV